MSETIKVRCPDCEGTGKSDEHFAAPFTIKTAGGTWHGVPYCPMCFGHGYVLAVLSETPSQESPK